MTDEPPAGDNARRARASRGACVRHVGPEPEVEEQDAERVEDRTWRIAR